MDQSRPRKKRLRPPPERYRAFINGEIDPASLDDEEIRRGQLRASDGSFKGQRPQSLPREFIIAMQMESQRRMEQDWLAMYEDAKAVYQEILLKRNASMQDKVRLDAAREVMERLQGKPVERVEIKATVSRFDEVAGDIIMDVENLPPTKALSATATATAHPTPAPDMTDIWTEE